MAWFKNIIDRVLDESALEELEILHSSFEFDLSRQSSLKRVAIASSMIDNLPLLPDLEELVLTDVREPTPKLSRFPQVSLITLVGPLDAVHSVDLSNNKLAEIRMHVVSPSQLPSVAGSRRSSFAVDITAEASWDNAMMTEAVCSTPASTTALNLVCTAKPGLEIPQCINGWTALVTMNIVRCHMPNFNFLPSTLTFLTLTSVTGTWTKADSGIDVSGPTSGYFDWSWLGSKLTSLQKLIMTGSDLVGTLPNHISSSSLNMMSISTAVGSKLSGTISPNWFRQYPSLSSLTLSNLDLSGTIPNYGMQSLETMILARNKFTHWPPLIINATTGFGAPAGLYYIDLSSNSLQQLPSESDFQTMKLLTFIVQSNPTLSVPFPNIFPSTGTPRTSSTLVVLINAGGCQFTGNLPEIPLAQISTYKSSGKQPTITFTNNQFNGSIPSSWSKASFSSLALANNPLEGTLAQIDSNGLVLSNPLNDTEELTISSYGLTGPMFNISALPRLKTINLSLPAVDFCASFNAGGYLFTYAPALTSCTLAGNAGSCRAAYPSICTVTNVVIQPPTVTPNNPTSSPTPANPPTDPSTPEGTLQPPPVSEPVLACPLPSPGAAFTCANGIWLSEGSVMEEKLILPGSSTTTIIGDLTTSTIVIGSSSSTINVTGCIATSGGDTPSITITLTQTDLEEIIKNGGSLTAHLLLQAPSCGAISPSSVNIDTSAIKSCKKVKTDKIGTSSGFSATFTVNSSGCNRWWIILVSVICGVIILAIIVVVVLAIVWRPFRERIRPFSRKRPVPGV